MESQTGLGPQETGDAEAAGFGRCQEVYLDRCCWCGRSECYFDVLFIVGVVITRKLNGVVVRCVFGSAVVLFPFLDRDSIIK